MSSKPLVLYHGPECSDGFTAAWAAWKYMPDAEFIPVQYGQGPPDVAGRDVFLLDFSYKRPVLEKMLESCASMVLLDHHKTAEAELSGLEHPKLTPVFDLAKCGARLAWERFFPHEEAPYLISLVEDRDLWRFALPDSRAINAYIRSLPMTFEYWDIMGAFQPPWQTPVYTIWTETLDGEWNHGDWDHAVVQGKAILRFQEEQVAASCRNAVEIELGGHRILAVNCTANISEVAGRLAETRPFGASYFIRGDGMEVWSLRSRNGAVDVSEVARRFGGGGHRAAAGFEVARGEASGQKASGHDYSEASAG